MGSELQAERCVLVRAARFEMKRGMRRRGGSGSLPLLTTPSILHPRNTQRPPPFPLLDLALIDQGTPPPCCPALCLIQDTVTRPSIFYQL
jgi:hypothetical protein